MQNNQFKLFVLSCLAFAVGGLNGGALGVAWIHIQAQFNLPLSSLGLLVGATTLGRMLMSFSSGSVVNRFGITGVLLMGMFVSLIGVLGFAITPSWALLIFSGFLTGVGAGAVGAGINSYAAFNFKSSQMNWLHASFGLGSTIGPFIVTLIVIDLGMAWQWGYIFITLVRFATLALFFITRNDWKIKSATSTTEKTTTVSINDTLHIPMVWLLILIFIMMVGIESTAGQLTNSLLIDSRSIDPKVAGTWISIYWGSLTVGRIVAGFIVDRISNNTFLRLTMFGMIIGAGLLWSNLSPMVSFLGIAIIGFAIAPFAPLMTSDTPMRVGRSHTPNVVGFQSAGGSIGMALLPWLGGVLGETFGLETIPPFIFAACVVSFLLHELILYREALRKQTLPLAVSVASPKK